MAADSFPPQGIRMEGQGLAAGDITVASGGDALPAFEARPAPPGTYPVIVVISFLWGLNDYIREVARRFARAGYYAVAPEMFYREWRMGHLASAAQTQRIVQDIPRQQILRDLSAVADHARRQPAARADRVGATGFSWGGSTTIQFAAHYKDLGAAVAWYGPPARAYNDDPPVTGFDVAHQIACPFLGLFSEEDASAPPADVRKFEELLKRHNRNVEIVTYSEAGRAVRSGDPPAAAPGAGKDAWSRCVAWFDRYLKA